MGALQRFGIGRLVAVLGAAAGAVAVLAAVMFNLGEPKALLFANVDLKEASQITTALDQAGVKYESKGDGSTILVPRDQVASTRLMLASKGLPTSGSVGYEIFDNSSALGQTDFVQNLNRQRALEGELARTIRSLRGVTSARVHLSLPRRQLFDEEAEQPTASVVVGIGGRDLGADQVRSLRNLVAGAVPNLKPDRVTVVDETGRMLAAGSDDSGFTSELAASRKSEAEDKIRRAVKDVVEGVVGPGKAKVQVNAELDLSRITTQEEKYDPDGQVVLSTTTNAENQSDTTGASNAGVTAAANVPGGQAGAGGGTEGSTSGKNEETTNYVVSKTTRTEIVEPGAVKRISVAVAVDGVTAEAKGGKPGAYTPRTAEEMQRIEQLVRSAVGFDQQRGDQVSVVNVKFEREAGALGGTEAKAPLFDFDKNDIIRAVELAILGVVGLLLIFFVLRPMMKAGGGAGAGFAGGPGAPALASSAAGAGGQGAMQLAYAGPGAADAAGAAALALPGPADVESRIDIAKIEGQVKVSSIKKVADFVDKHPDESVSILRSWLHES